MRSRLTVELTYDRDTRVFQARVPGIEPRPVQPEGLKREYQPGPGGWFRACGERELWRLLKALMAMANPEAPLEEAPP